MPAPIRRILGLALVLSLIVATAARADTTTFTDTYRGYNVWKTTVWDQPTWSFKYQPCQLDDTATSNPYGNEIFGREPATDGRYPVYVFVHGLGGKYDATEGQRYTAEAANRGFVAASVAIASTSGGTPTGREALARCAFGSTVPGSALAKLCARPKADCSLGVVVQGNSLGAAVAARARNWDPRVRAAFLTAFSGPAGGSQAGFQKDASGNIISTTLAPPAGDRALANDAIRIVNGNSDFTSITEPLGSYGVMNALTGKSCSTLPCLAPDGSGYYSVQNSEVSDGTGDHCFYGIGKCAVTFTFDPGFVSTTTPWGLAAGLDWLASRTG